MIRRHHRPASPSRYPLSPPTDNGPQTHSFRTSLSGVKRTLCRPESRSLLTSRRPFAGGRRAARVDVRSPAAPARHHPLQARGRRAARVDFRSPAAPRVVTRCKLAAAALHESTSVRRRPPRSQTCVLRWPPHPTARCTLSARPRLSYPRTHRECPWGRHSLPRAHLGGRSWSRPRPDSATFPKEIGSRPSPRGFLSTRRPRSARVMGRVRPPRSPGQGEQAEDDSNGNGGLDCAVRQNTQPALG